MGHKYCELIQLFNRKPLQILISDLWTPVTSRDDVIMPISKQIRILCKNTFDLRYHTTRCNQRKKMTPFSASHYDVTVYLNFFYDVIKRKIVKKWPYIPNLRKKFGAVFECLKFALSPPFCSGGPLWQNQICMRTHRITIGSKLSTLISFHSIQEESFSYLRAAP